MTDIIDQINYRGFAHRDEWKYARDAWADRQWSAEVDRLDRESGRRAFRMKSRNAVRQFMIAMLRTHPWLRRLL